MSQMQHNNSSETDPPSFEGMTLSEACERLFQLANHSSATLPSRTRFKLKSVDFEARVIVEEPDHVMLSLSACLGYLPYTAEDEWTRRAVLDMARAATEQLPAKVKIDRANKVWLVQETKLDEKPKANELMPLLAQMALHVTPLIDTLHNRVIPIQAGGPLGYEEIRA